MQLEPGVEELAHDTQSALPGGSKNRQGITILACALGRLGYLDVWKMNISSYEYSVERSNSGDRKWA